MNHISLNTAKRGRKLEGGSGHDTHCTSSPETPFRASVAAVKYNEGKRHISSFALFLLRDVVAGASVATGLKRLQEYHQVADCGATAAAPSGWLLRWPLFVVPLLLPRLLCQFAATAATEAPATIALQPLLVFNEFGSIQESAAESRSARSPPVRPSVVLIE